MRRIEATNGAVNAIVAMDADAARKRAKAIDEAIGRGDDLGLLAGLPIGIQAMGPPGGDRTTVEFAALLTEALGGYRVPPEFRSSVTSIA